MPDCLVALERRRMVTSAIRRDPDSAGRDQGDLAGGHVFARLEADRAGADDSLFRPSTAGSARRRPMCSRSSPMSSSRRASGGDRRDDPDVAVTTRLSERQASGRSSAISAWPT
jgi:hypothetical protein